MAERDEALTAEEQEQRDDCRSYRLGHACLLCNHRACGWCPECSPEVPEW